MSNKPKKRWLRIAIGYALLGVASVNCVYGWKPATELEWSMWIGNVLLFIVAHNYTWKHSK